MAQIFAKYRAMNFMRTIYSTFFAATICLQAFAQNETVKIAYLTNGLDDASNSAVMCGARDAFKEMGAKFHTNFEITFVDERGVEERANRLASLCFENYSAAIIRPAKNDEALAKKVAELSKFGFVSACVESDFGEETGRVCFVSTDKEKILETLRKTIAFIYTPNTDLLCFFKTDEDSFSTKADSEEFKNFLSPRFKPNDFKGVFPRTPLRIEAVKFFSAWAKDNKIDLERTDNHAIIFIGADTIADMQPFPSDSDRKFTVCLGASPQLCFYLENKQLDAIIYDDYYGWGYICARAIAEKICDSKKFKVSEKMLLPLKATKRNPLEYSENWKKWLK